VRAYTSTHIRERRGREAREKREEEEERRREGERERARESERKRECVGREREQVHVCRCLARRAASSQPTRSYAFTH
jgi:hypothetical protein